MAKGIKVPLRDAERVRTGLLKKGIFDDSKKIKSNRDFVIFPVKDKFEDYELISTKFEPAEKRKKFEDYLFEFLSQKELQKVRYSFDVIGNIAIVEIPGELEKQEQKIAQSLMKAHKNIKTVFKKSGEVKGEERLRDLKFLCGEEKTETIHREHGCRFKLDVAKVYFSPRLSYERQRILGQVKDGEVIVDLFAGVGPFSILLAKYRDVKVHAIDMNPAAVKYLKENIKLNKVEGRVTPLLGDVREVAPRNVATRAIMNLPKSSAQFLDLAFDVIERGVIHFYAISPEDDLYDPKINFIKKIAKEKNRKVKILNKRIVRPYSPRNYHVVIDVVVKK
ncbi:MAG: class I SAM-dependent methyltransferase family protein [Methanobacteriota archaeon]